jgi:hypothetical protein
VVLPTSMVLVPAVVTAYHTSSLRGMYVHLS